MIRLIRLFCKPFMFKELPSNLINQATQEEVIGLGYHPERYSGSNTALFQELPRVAVDMEFDDSEELETIRKSLSTGEYGDGKIFIFPVEGFIEF